MEEKKDKILDEEFNNQLKEILDAGPDKYQREKLKCNEDSLKESKKLVYHSTPEARNNVFLYTLIRIIAVATAIFLLVKLGLQIASR